MQILGRYGEAWAKVFNEDSNRLMHAKRMLGTLEAIHEAAAQRLLVQVEDLVMAEAFSDLLEQAEHLFTGGYFLAAAVIGRAVLEEHLRKWCQHAGCAPAKTRLTLSDYYGELYKSQHISKIELKHIASMTSIGNDAAHGNKANKEEVERLLRDLTAFLSQHPIE